MAKWSSTPIASELPRLVDQDPQLSLRKVAQRAGVDPAHLSRALRGKGEKHVSGELAGRLAAALELPVDYFPEYREDAVMRAVRADGQLRDRLYRRLGRQDRLA